MSQFIKTPSVVNFKTNEDKRETTEGPLSATWCILINHCSSPTARQLFITELTRSSRGFLGT